MSPKVEDQLKEFVPILDHMEHLPVREINLKQIAGKKILEVGPQTAWPGRRHASSQIESYFYIFNQFLVQGILRGNYARNGGSVGKVSEGEPQHSDRFNPLTRVYTKSEML
jgi:hypothetical protein